MKLKFKLQKASSSLVQQQQQEVNAMKMEDSALHGLAAVAVAVEQADSKGGLLDNNLNAEDALDISTIKLERCDESSAAAHDLSTNGNGSSSRSTTDSSLTTCNRSISNSNNNNNNNSNNNNNPIIKPKASAQSASESIETDLAVKLAENHRCRSSKESLHAVVATTTTTNPSSGSVPPMGMTRQCPRQQQQQQQQQVRVIKDGRFYEGGSVHLSSQSQSAFLALNGKEDLRITQITNSSGCGGGGNKLDLASNLVNVISVASNQNGPMALDTVKMKLGENDTQIFRAPMVTSTTNQHSSPGSSPGVVVTVESTNCSMRPPAVPPRSHLQQQQQQQQQIHGSGNGFGGAKINKQCPSAAAPTAAQHQSSSEEPSSSIPDLGESPSSFLREFLQIYIIIVMRTDI